MGDDFRQDGQGRPLRRGDSSAESYRQPHAHLGTKHVSPRGQPVQRPHSAPPWKRRHLPSLSCFHLSLEEFFEEEENNSNK